MLAIETPLSIYPDLDGSPLDFGSLYFGQPNQNPVTAPVAVYWDAAGTQPAAQPIQTMNGFPVRAGTPSTVFVDGNYSLLVKNRSGIQVLYAQDSADFSNAAINANALVSFKADLANTADPLKGSGLSGFNFSLNYAAGTAGWGVRAAQGLPSLLEYVPVSEWAAILNGTSTTDLTSYIQSALNTGRVFFAPRGKWCVSATTMLTIPNGGGGIVGAGKNHTIFWALSGTGGSEAQIAAYTAGSVFRRAFNPVGTNVYVGGVLLSDFGIILNHPTGSVTTTTIQVGIDLRHIGRFDVERVHVGNYAPISSFVSKSAPPNGYAQQGYGIITGTVDSGSAAYAGGEVGNIKSCAVWGAYKGISLDDATLAPLSSSHGINVIGCDIQGCHALLVQEQQYTTGMYWAANTLQNTVRRTGDASPTYVMRIAGYENEVHPGYIEAGVTDHIVRLESASANNRIRQTHYSATTIGVSAFSDGGRRNTIQICKDTGSFAGGVDSKGIPIELFDRSYRDMSIICHYSGSAMVIDGGLGITVTRPTTAGDYLFAFEKPMLDANGYTWDVSYDTNVSGHGGTHAVISHSASNIRIQFYGQNGGATTAIDPRFVSLRIRQV